MYLTFNASDLNDVLGRLKSTLSTDACRPSLSRIHFHRRPDLDPKMFEVCSLDGYCMNVIFLKATDLTIDNGCIYEDFNIPFVRVPKKSIHAGMSVTLNGVDIEVDSSTTHVPCQAAFEHYIHYQPILKKSAQEEYTIFFSPRVLEQISEMAKGKRWVRLAFTGTLSGCNIETDDSVGMALPIRMNVKDLENHLVMPEDVEG